MCQLRNAIALFARGAVFALALSVLGCATPVDHWSQQLPGKKLATVSYLEDGPYARNSIVHVPSVTGFLLAVPPALVVGAAVELFPLVTVAIDVISWGLTVAIDVISWGLTDDVLAIYVANDVTWLIVDIVALSFGTPFLPFSYLVDESRREFPAGPSPIPSSVEGCPFLGLGDSGTIGPCEAYRDPRVEWR